MSVTFKLFGWTYFYDRYCRSDCRDAVRIANNIISVYPLSCFVGGLEKLHYLISNAVTWLDSFDLKLLRYFVVKFYSYTNNNEKLTPNSNILAALSCVLPSKVGNSPLNDVKQVIDFYKKIYVEGICRNPRSSIRILEIEIVE